MQRPCCVALVGDPGVGKSLMLDDLAHSLSSFGQDVTLWRGQGPHKMTSPGTLAATALPPVVLVDTADSEMLAELYALARPQVASVFAGPPALAARLRARRRGIAVVELAAADRDGVAALLATELQRAGLSPDMLAPEAIMSLYRHAAGVPRTLHSCLSLAVFLARLEEADRVTAAHVDEAAGLLQACGGAHIIEAAFWDLDDDGPPHALLPRDDSAGVGPLAPERSAVLVGTRTERPYTRRRLPYAAMAALAAGILAFPSHVGQDEAALAPRPVAAAAVVPDAVALSQAPPPPDMAASRSPLPERPSSPPPVMKPPEPELLASARPALLGPVTTSVATTGGSALVLRVRPGDTLQSLYRQVYQGRTPPPLADVAAANHLPLAAGEIIVFPAPPQGW